MNARQRRKFRRHWSRVLGEPLTQEETQLAASTSRWVRYVNRAIRGPRCGRVFECSCYGYDYCHQCGDVGLVHSSQWLNDHEGDASELVQVREEVRRHREFNCCDAAF